MAKQSDRPNFSDTLKMYLLSEVQSKCPLCLCSLIVKKINNSNIRIFDVAHIYPFNPTPNEIKLLLNEERLTDNINGEENLITLCKPCHKKYDTNKTVDDYRRLLAIKKEAIKIKSTEILWNNQSLHHDISIVAQKISTLRKNDIINTVLSLNALTISEKIDNSISLPNEIKISEYAKMYYSPIKDSFKILELENKASTDFIFQQVKCYYLALKIENLTQDEIFLNMCNWFMTKTEITELAKAEILVSFFIQNCEVFSSWFYLTKQ
nr:ABC-three component system protein [Providencia heimbachae]